MPLLGMHRLIRILIATMSLVSGSTLGAPETQELSIDEPRPVAAAAMQLMKRHGLWITYEDPRYQYEADVQDVALLVRKDLHKYPPGNVPKVMVPAAGKVRLRYSVPETQSSSTVAALVQRVIDYHNNGESLGSFRLRRGENHIEILPARVRDLQGVWTEHKPLLDFDITIPAGERRTYETLQAFCRAVSESSGTEVFVGSVPLNLVLSTHQSLGVEEPEEARQVLLRIIGGTETRLAWFLFYDPGSDTYALNLLPVPVLEPQTRPAPRPTPRRAPVLPGVP